jgi:hypothetical protein
MKSHLGGFLGIVRITDTREIGGATGPPKVILKMPQQPSLLSSSEAAGTSPQSAISSLQEPVLLSDIFTVMLFAVL